MYCKTCGTQLAAAVTTCSKCGTTVVTPSELIKCPSCGQTATPGTNFCKKCGTRLEEVRSGTATVTSASECTTLQQSSSTSRLPALQSSIEDRCPHCGAITRSGAKFCKSCGKSRLPSETILAVKSPPVVSGAPPLPIKRPAHGASAPKPPSTKSKARVVLVTAGVLVLVLGAAGAAYWRFGYPHKLLQANSIANPASSQPVAPSTQDSQPAQPTTGDAAATQLSVTQETSQETQPSSGVSETPATTNALVRSGSASSRNRSNGAGVQPATPAAPPYQQAHMNAEQSFAAGQYIDPPNNSALYWARMASQQRDPNAGQIEQQVLQQMESTVQAQRANHNYDSAITLLSRLMQLFPDRPELPQMGNSIADEQQAYNRQLEQQRKAQEFKAQTKEFRVQHRHFMGLQSQNFNPTYGYCQGVLRITPDGTAKYDCTQADGRGRCDHTAFTAADIKEVQPKNDGMLHLALRSGKFDFMADPATIQAAADALRRLGH